MKLRDYQQLKFKNNVVIFDNVLFLHQENRAQHQFQVMMGELEIPSRSIEAYHNTINFNKQISKKQGFKYRHIVFPAKPILYREHELC